MRRLVRKGVSARSRLQSLLVQTRHRARTVEPALSIEGCLKGSSEDGKRVFVAAGEE